MKIFIGVPMYTHSLILMAIFTSYAALSAPADPAKIEPKMDLLDLLNKQQKWVKVHAAEFLIWQDAHIDEVRNIYMDEETKFSDTSQYRIGVWRVLAQSAQTLTEREFWVNRIVNVYTDEKASDRLHAIETLAKLKHAAISNLSEAVDPIDNEITSFNLYRLWNATYLDGVDKEALRSKFVELLESTSKMEDPLLVTVTSFILRSMPTLTSREWHRIASIALAYHGNIGIRSGLLATAWLLAPDGEEGATYQNVRQQLLSLKCETAARMNVLIGLGAARTDDDRDLVKQLYLQLRDTRTEAYNVDAHVTAAYMMMKTFGNNYVLQ